MQFSKLNDTVQYMVEQLPGHNRLELISIHIMFTVK